MTALPKINFFNLSKAALATHLEEDLAVEARHIKMRVAQIWRGVYVDGAQDFTAITTLGAPLRAKLGEVFSLTRPLTAKLLSSTDGTKKWLLTLEGGGSIEMVFIPEPEKGRGTLCLSSQIGCTLTCSFCRTGTQKWERNLTAGEVIGQVLLAQDELAGWGIVPRPLTNIVFMGQGEPLLNLDNTIQAIKILTDPDGLAFSKRKITVSTAGVVPAIKQLGEETGVRLALSLHGVRNDQRAALVPLNKKYNIEALLQAARAYAALIKDRITFEYVLLDGVNDSIADAQALVKLIAGIPAKINLIPFNGWESAPYTCSTQTNIDRFAALINHAGYAAPVRRARGPDIMAACGQLKTHSQERGAHAK